MFAAMSDDPAVEYLIVDSTIIRAHQHAAGAKKGAEDQALGRSRGGLSTKIHMVVRGLGCPVRFTLTAGQKGDAPQADALIEGPAAAHRRRLRRLMKSTPTVQMHARERRR
jgi:transposase